MEIKVLWTQTALNDLESIFEYYKDRASLRVAKKFVKQLVEATILLQNLPEIGRVEELLKSRKFKYRFVIVKNYKII